MNFGHLFRAALEISWKFKLLWILGFFASFFGGSARLIGHDYQARLGDIVSHQPTLIFILVVYAFLLLLFFVIMHLLCTAGLIDAVVRIRRGDKFTLKDSFKTGAHYFWNLLGLWLLLLAAMLAVVAVMAIPAALAFAGSLVIGFLLILIMVPLFLIIFLGCLAIYSLAQRKIVIDRRGLVDAVGEALGLVRRRPGENLVIILIIFITGLLLYGLNSLLVLVFALPLIFIIAHSTVLFILALFFALPIYIAVAIGLTGFFGTLSNTLFTIFYQELIGSQSEVPASPAPEPPA